jgi:peptidase E
MEGMLLSMKIWRDGAFKRHGEALMNVAGVKSLHRLDHMMGLPEEEIKKILSKVEGMYVSGGNTYRLSQEMFNSSFPWAEYITEMAKEGRPYVGVSAGLLIAQKRFEVCFDDQIEPSNQGFGLMNLKDTQISVHLESEDNHGPSETDLNPFVTENRSVLALNDGTWLRAEKGQLHFEGVAGMRALMMKSGQPSQSIPVGTDLSYLLA